MLRLTSILLIYYGILVECQLQNRPPHFIPGSGDMARFSISENTPNGSVVYQLRGIDPEGGQLKYSISGPVFSVDKNTGVVRLNQGLDREKQDLIEVIISITDESVLGSEPNTISLRREIPIRDYNDNAPIFIGRPYSANVSEAIKAGTLIKIEPTIFVTDRDEGINSEISVKCASDPNFDTDDICEIFEVTTEKLASGNYTVAIRLKKQLDFETRPSYILSLKANDGALENRLSALASVAISVIDIQDQPPIFLNAPYSKTVLENTPPGIPILMVNATDGDTGSPRPLLLTLENEKFGYFILRSVNDTNQHAILYTTNVPLDRENAEILQNGGVYSFTVRATELINNEVPGDSATSQITIVVSDVDDHIPMFNQQEFKIPLTENLENDTPLPGLSILVIDKDLGVNSRYNLSLVNVKNADGVFAVTPTYGEGRTPIVVKVANSKKLDYDVDDIDLRTLVFDLVASVNGTRMDSSRVTIELQDANDNAPVFFKNFYTLEVKENTKIGYKISDLSASDRDSGVFGSITYLLKGFGSEYFSTDQKYGAIFVKKNLNYEVQKSYSLTLVAIDGGGIETNANLLINVLDVNDNNPMFETLEYTRTIREGATEFEPQFFVRATDEDGPTQGGGQITYTIDSENSISGHVFSINPSTGEITINRRVSSMDTERGQYELIVSATDHGVPPLKNDTRVLIRVGISGNQRPIFKGHFTSQTNNAIPGPPSYRITIPENAPPGFNVTTVTASDPDGLDSLLEYRIVDSADNFEINPRSGLIKVSSFARLDRDTNSDQHIIVVNAVDAGFPIPETATATVYIKIQDVNDKPPKFNSQTYTAYVSERSKVGTEVLKVLATDTDLDSKIEYSIIDPIKASSKTGSQLISTVPYDYRSAFSINNETGQVIVNSTLDYNSAAVITLTVQARDVNALYNKNEQFDTTEVILFIQSFKDTNPIFKHRGWTSTSPLINMKVKEETPIGMTIFKLLAEDPLTHEIIKKFELTKSDPLQIIEINEFNGDVLLRKRLDYETLNSSYFEFGVTVYSSDLKRITFTMVNVTVENVNDNDPIFDHKTYRVTVLENLKYPTKILEVHATDNDSVLTELDEQIGYNLITYSLTGQNSAHFLINNKTGVIQIAPNYTLDREKQSVVKVLAVAEDSLGKPSDSRKTSAEIIIEVLDVNDNAPQFLLKSYTAVIPENSPINTFVINMLATDPDEGFGGEIRYDLLNEGETNGLLKINPNTGEIRTRAQLTGRGRSEPYELVIRAQDNGGKIPKQPSLHSDVSLVLYIGDVSANDGIPFFISPKVGQVANISENATIGSPVFQVIASDPDNPASPSGQLSYNIQEDVENKDTFRIDHASGLITTLKSLDRETKSSYNIIVEVSDHGDPPQAATIVLYIFVLDIDDHKPRFIREVDATPLELMVLEEQPVGTIISNLSAIDEDIDENGAIDYMFIDGNELGIFKITRTDDNQAIITTGDRIDREKYDSFLLTVKCFKYKTNRNLISYKSYDAYDLSEMQILIKLIDIDDHLPEFNIKDQTIGVRLYTPIDTHILTVRATDEDPDSAPIRYSLENVTFIPQYFKKENSNLSYNLTELFSLDSGSGEIKIMKTLSDFVDGYFEIEIRANNSKNPSRYSHNIIKLYVIRDKSLLRFVFSKPASEVNTIIDEFTTKMQSELKMTDLELHVFDPQVLVKSDHSLDFSSTSSCFQLSRHGSVLPPHEMQKIMDSNEIKNMLTESYIKYSVDAVDSCLVKRKLASASFITSTGTWLVMLAGLIGIASFIATISACCLTRRYKNQIKRVQSTPIHRIASPSENYGNGTPVIYAEPIYGPL